jgi:hypothetical protein
MYLGLCEHTTVVWYNGKPYRVRGHRCAMSANGKMTDMWMAVNFSIDGETIFSGKASLTFHMNRKKYSHVFINPAPDPISMTIVNNATSPTQKEHS